MRYQNIQKPSPEAEEASAADVKACDLAGTSEQLVGGQEVSIQLDKIAYVCPSPNHSQNIYKHI